MMNKQPNEPKGFSPITLVAYGWQLDLDLGWAGPGMGKKKAGQRHGNEPIH